MPLMTAAQEQELEKTAKWFHDIVTATSQDIVDRPSLIQAHAVVAGNLTSPNLAHAIKRFMANSLISVIAATDHDPYPDQILVRNQ